MRDTKIEWCHHTANLWHGCTEVHAGCDNCYARVLDHRWGKNNWGQTGPRTEINTSFNLFLKLQKEALMQNKFHTVFVGSMMDIFEKPMPVIDSKKKDVGYTTEYLRKRYFEKVVPYTPNLIHLMLTKRPSNIRKYIPKSWIELPPENIMYGSSPVDAQTAEQIIPELLKLKGKKFLSIEPMLGPIKLSEFMSETEKPDWIIVGGESGHGKRVFHPDWARSIMNECETLNIPFFMKQWDKVKEIPGDLMIREFPKFFTKQPF